MSKAVGIPEGAERPAPRSGVKQYPSFRALAILRANSSGEVECAWQAVAWIVLFGFDIMVIQGK